VKPATVSHIALVVLVAGILLSAAILVSRTHVHFGYIDEDKREAQSAIDQMHSRLAAGEYEGIFDDLDTTLQETASREALIDGIRKTNERWGAVKRVTHRSINVLADRAPVEVRVVYNTSFEKGDATEFLILVRRGEKLRIAFYRVYQGTTVPKEFSVTAP
jgi:hypothetical protein